MTPESSGLRSSASVCKACERMTAERLPRADPYRTVTAENDGLSVTKSVVLRDGALELQYDVDSERSSPVLFRVRDQYPKDSCPARDGPDVGDGGYTAVDTTWWLEANGKLTFRRTAPGNDGATEPLPDGCLTNVAPHVSVLESDFGSPSADVDRPGADAPFVVAALPAYNEAASIGDVVASAEQYVDAVLVVDDGSDDETRTRAWEAGAFVVSHDSNRGYGATLKTIFSIALDIGTDHLVILDSDGQHDPMDIPCLVARQRSADADIVIGNRFGERADTRLPLYRRFGLWIINVLTNLGIGRKLTGKAITDTQSGFRAYRPRPLASLYADDSIGERMEISTDILYHAEQRGYNIAEVGSTIRYDVEGASSHNPVVHGYILVRNLLPMIGRERPLFVLGVLGVMTATLAVVTVMLLPVDAVPSSNGALVGAVPTLAIPVAVLACLGGGFHALRRI